MTLVCQWCARVHLQVHTFAPDGAIAMRSIRIEYGTPAAEFHIPSFGEVILLSSSYAPLRSDCLAPDSQISIGLGMVISSGADRGIARVDR